MTEQQPIVYKSLGFTLGLGGSSASGRAASTFLDTLISAVPSAKALLPTLVPDPSKRKDTVDDGQRKEPLSSPSEAAAGEQASAKLQQEQELKADPAEPIVATAEKQEAAPTAAPTDDGVAVAATGTKPASAEFIPLPETAPVTAPTPASATKAPAPGSADALAEDEDIRRLGQRPYWMSYISRIDSPLLRLHQEVLELCELVQPTPEEAAARRAAVEAVTEVVRSIWPNARVEIFGSFATGLYVPTSDIDLVILDSSCSNIQAGLKALATALGKREVAQNIQVIGKARVPIIKFETVGFGNLAFDISFDVANGPQAAVLVAEMTAAWPMMRPIILCLKLFLQQRELNEVYTGGIGSYALITLVSAFLQLHASRRTGGGKQQPQPVYGTSGDAALASRSGAVEPGLGMLLVDFFRFYGRVVNIPEVGISCTGGGQFFRKVDKPTPNGMRGFSGWLNYDRSHLLAVEDPKDPDNDVCRNSFNIMRVKTAFEYAYQMLTAPAKRDESLLSRILRLGPILASRPRPRVQHLRELGYYLTPSGQGDQIRRDRERRRSQQREERRQQQQQQDSPSGRAGNEGRKRPTPARSAGGRAAGKKRQREEGAASPGAGGGAGDGTAGGAGSGKKPRREEAGGKAAGAAAVAVAGSAAVEAKRLRKEAKKARQKERREAVRQQQLQERQGSQGQQDQQQQRQQQGEGATPGRRGSSGGGGSGSGGSDRPKKRRREETSPAAAPAAAAPDRAAAQQPAAAAAATEAPAPAAAAEADARGRDATPARSSKRARVEAPPPRPQQQQQEHQPKERRKEKQERRGGRAGGNGGRSRDGGGRQTAPPQHNNHHPPPQQRRPALMHVTVSAVPPPAPVPQQAPIFHPGYAPPPSHGRQQHRSHHHSHHSHHESSHHQNHSDGARHGGYASHHSHHHDHRPHEHHGGYPGGGPRGGGGGGGDGAGRSRAPILVHQQAPPQSYPQPRGRSTTTTASAPTCTTTERARGVWPEVLQPPRGAALQAPGAAGRQQQPPGPAAWGPVKGALQRRLPMWLFASPLFQWWTAMSGWAALRRCRRLFPAGTRRAATAGRAAGGR